LEIKKSSCKKIVDRAEEGGEEREATAALEHCAEGFKIYIMEVCQRMKRMLAEKGFILEPLQRKSILRKG
jgi:hypothetical protein